MTITQLQYVLAIAEHRNFTVAAEHCHVTQPTLSMQIQKMEDELGVLIFDRNKKPIQLTEVGEKIVAQSKSIIHEASRMNDIVDQFKGFIGGEFRLGIIPTVMPTLLPMFLKTFSKEHSKVNLIIEELTTDELIEKLKNGHLDAAIAATPLKEDKIKELPLYYEPFVAYIPESNSLFAKNKISVEDLDLQDLLLLQDGHCFRESVLNLCNFSAVRRDKFEIKSGSFETLLKLCNEGFGMTLLPYLHTLDLNAEEKKRLREFVEPKPAREISLIFHQKHLKMHIIDALHASISSVIRGAISFHDVKIISPKVSKNNYKKSPA